MTERMEEFKKYLTGGFEHNKLLHLKDGDDDKIVMFMMDAEFDLVRIEYGPEDDVSIYADGHDYHMFSADQLQFIADQVEDAMEMWEDIFADCDD
ncbi:MAG: hypothetical protein ACEPO2_07405 [Pelagibaca sp.]